MSGKTFFIDLTKCTACRGCQVACKQWHKLPAEKTRNHGSHQNPQDLSFITYKLVRFTEPMIDGKVDWLFFPEQCRHCVYPPCKEVADSYDENAILQDPLTGAVIFTDLTAKLDIDEIRGACPYDIPRQDEKSKIMSKCDMCLDRVHNGMKPACVQTCPTGAMNFGDREDMLELAEAGLKNAQKKWPNAELVNTEDVRVIYLAANTPSDYYEYMSADASKAAPSLYTRKKALAKLTKPFKRMMG